MPPYAPRATYAVPRAQGQVLGAPATSVNKKRLLGRTVTVRSLDASQRDAMWQVFAAYYTDVSREMFEHDLADKSHIILLVDTASDRICGFSTIKTYDLCVQGRRVVVLFSGDTVVDRAYWGQKALHSAFLRNALALKLKHPFCPVYWFLITKGYKTYLLLSRNFPEYWPRYDKPTPAWQSALIDQLARDRFGSAWDPELGIVRFDTPHGKLKGAVAPISDKLLSHPDIRFFTEKNPGHADGDELCCIGRLGFGLVPPFFTKLLARALWPRARTRRLTA